MQISAARYWGMGILCVVMLAAVVALEPTERERIPHNVARGAAFLDAHYPGWERVIDLKRLDVMSLKDGIMQQLEKRECLTNEDVPCLSGSTGIELGFTPAYPGHAALIEQAWRGMVQDREATAGRYPPAR